MNGSPADRGLGGGGAPAVEGVEGIDPRAPDGLDGGERGGDAPPARLGAAALLAPAPFIGWFALSLGAGERRWELAAAAVAAPLLAYGSAERRRLFLRAYPLTLVGIAYDAQRLLGGLGLSPERVHACDLRDLDRGIARLVGAGGAALPELAQRHGAPAADLLAAVPYGTFLLVAVGYALYVAWSAPGALARYAWSFLALNLLAFATYRIYPAAPPWYVLAHGCAVDPSVLPSEGPSLARVDQLLGTPYFHAFYARSRDVFGAVPSLHVAYPLLVLLDAWRRHRGAGRALAATYVVWMAFSAVYLAHHWVIDVLLGAAYAVLAFTVVRLFADRPALPSRSKVAR